MPKAASRRRSGSLFRSILCCGRRVTSWATRHPWASAISSSSPTSSRGCCWSCSRCMSAISWYLIVYKGISLVDPPEAQQEVPGLLLERHLARGGAERAHRARRARAVRPSDRPFAARPGASRQVRRGQARGDRQRAGVPDPHHQEGARRGDDVARERPHHAGHHRRHRAVRRPVRHGVGRLSRAGGDRHDAARACSTRWRARSARR